jgi:hypothetical protein
MRLSSLAHTRALKLQDFFQILTGTRMPAQPRLKSIFRKVVSTFRARPLFCTHDTVAI